MSEPDWNDDDSWILDSLYGINREGRTTYSNDDLDDLDDGRHDDSFYDDDID